MNFGLKRNTNSVYGISAAIITTVYWNQKKKKDNVRLWKTSMSRMEISYSYKCNYLIKNGQWIVSTIRK